MGRGLSPLQTTLLDLAYQRWARYGESLLLTSEGYKAVYGWEKTSVRSSSDTYEEWYGRFTWDIAAIGAATYNRGAATVSRAIRRLVTRGFLAPYASGDRTRADGWTLTAAGLAMAERLSVKNKNYHTDRRQPAANHGALSPSG